LGVDPRLVGGLLEGVGPQLVDLRERVNVLAVVVPLQLVHDDDKGEIQLVLDGEDPL